MVWGAGNRDEQGKGIQASIRSRWSGETFTQLLFDAAVPFATPWTPACKAPLSSTVSSESEVT